MNNSISPPYQFILFKWTNVFYEWRISAVVVVVLDGLVANVNDNIIVWNNCTFSV